MYTRLGDRIQRGLSDVGGAEVGQGLGGVVGAEVGQGLGGVGGAEVGQGQLVSVETMAPTSWGRTSPR